MEDFWSKVIGTYLAELTGNAAEKVANTLADLWRNRGAPPSAAQAELPAPFNSPPRFPPSETPLFGRETEFVEILKLLRESRLVTLTGLGGVGKTALAQTVAQWVWEMEGEGRLEHETRERGENRERAPLRGVVYVGLDALGSGRGLGEFVRLRIVPDSQPPATDDPVLRREDAVRVIGAALKRYARLVVLDNFESAMDGGAGEAEALALVTDLVGAVGSEVRFLVTSRIALNPAADIEKEFEVKPLAQPDALDLFYARAGDKLTRNETNIGDVSEICRLVDNLPLAVELAARAYKIGHLPLREIREGLRVTPLDVEAANLLGYPERQRGLVASFRYTFNHLNPAAQRLYMLMHIFRGSADRDAIKHVDASVNWSRALSELVNWNLVDEDRTRDPWRYSMLATTEAFSRFQFKTNPNEPRLDENEFRQLHAEYYVKVAARFSELPMERWREIEEADWENIKAGADWAVGELEAREGATVEELLARIDELPSDGGEAGLAGEYALQLYKFIFLRRTLEGRRWLGAALIAFQRAGDKRDEALICNSLGLWFDSRGSYREALWWYERSVKISDEIRDMAGLAATYTNIGLIHDTHGSYAEALGWYERSIKILEEVGDAAALASTYNNIGEVHRALGAYDEALGWYERSVKIREEIGDMAGLAMTYNNIGLVHRTRGAYDEALGWYERSVKISEEIGDAAGLATTYGNIGGIHFARQEDSDALEWLTKSLKIRKEIGDRNGVAQGTLNAAKLALAMGKRAEAEEYARESLRLYREMGLEKDVEKVRGWMRENGIEE